MGAVIYFVMRFLVAPVTYKVTVKMLKEEDGISAAVGWGIVCAIDTIFFWPIVVIALIAFALYGVLVEIEETKDKAHKR
jgi:uncharacterized membrane protein